MSKKWVLDILMPNLISFFCFYYYKRKWLVIRQLLHMFNRKYDEIIKIENLLIAWQKFLRGKRYKKDVMIFQMNLSHNLTCLWRELDTRNYTHGSYSLFEIYDPKPRTIHKASVRDRLLHHLVYSEIYPYFDQRFIHDSYSCRKDKGLHCALDRFDYFAGKVSKNNTRACWVLKCDVKKFFASIDHKILLHLLKRRIADSDIILLIEKIILSFNNDCGGKGLPLGNITSQFFANVYLHEFDIYAKQELRIKYYLRYADDFAILADDRQYLEILLSGINAFLNEKLRLKLHQNTIIKTYASGVDFLGWMHFPYYRQIRTTTKRRIVHCFKDYCDPQVLNSYRGLLKYGNTYKLQKLIF